jgi:MraZ protein
MFYGFIGNYTQTLDQKNRVVIPAKFRALFEAGTHPAAFYITRGPDKCLLMFTPQQWERWEEKHDAATEAKEMQASVRQIDRMLFGNAHFYICDKLGRITIPSPLVEHAGLEKDVVIVGVRNRMEIWAAERWNEHQARAAENFENLIEDIYQSQ